MPRVHLRNSPVVNLEGRVSGLLERLRTPVRRFLQQPGSDAKALFEKIFNAFSQSPLLGLSALAGFVGLFAYAKALRELETIPVYVGSLISAADVTAFGVRLAVPFVLLALAGAAVVFGLIAILAIDHRNERDWYWGLTITAVISCGGLLTLYALWVAPGALEGLGLVAVWLIVSAVLLGWARRLYKYGRTPGIKRQDEFHRKLLRVLGRIAHPGMLLLGVLLVGLYLTVVSNYSILFDPPLGKWSRDSLCSNLLVLVTKSPADRILVDRATALGSILLVQKVDGSVTQWQNSGACSGSLRKKSANDRAADPRHWLILQAADVRCMGPLAAERECELANPPRPPGNPPPPPVTPPPIARGPASIAQYAQTFLGCGPASFETTDKALVFNFSEGHPGNAPGKRRWIHRFRTVPMSALSLPGLDGVRGDMGDKEHPEEFVRRAVTSYPREKLWVLGFASVSGRSSSNADLSENRARVVLEYLRHFPTEFPAGSIGGRTRGLGANLFSGLGRAQQDAGEQLAVAFLCRGKASDSDGTVGRASTQVESPREKSTTKRN
jgi:hypothetical protein